MSRVMPLVALLLSLPAAAQEGPGRPQELEPLARWIGAWEFRITKVSQGEPPAAKVTKSFTWTLNRRYLRCKTYTSDERDHSFTALSTYDRRRGEYRRWIFGSRGQAHELTGAWDGEKKAFSWKGQYAPNVNFSSVSRFVDKDTVRWKTTLTDDEGTVLHGAEGTMKRVAVEF